MHRLVLLLTVSLVLGLSAPVRADATGEYSDTVIPTPPLPAPYQQDVVYPQSGSPDHQYAFIYPARSVLFDLPKARLVLVALKPFRAVAPMPDYDGFLAITSGGFFVANWAKDSSA